VAAARAAADTLRARPEFAGFAARRERLARQADAVGAGTRPRLNAYARAGYGRPGLNFLSDRFQAYWLGGVQVQWAPFDWGRTGRDREALAVERALADADEAAFRAQLARATRGDLAAMDRLARAIAVDDSIIALRAEVLREATARYREGAITTAEYVARESELLAARRTQAVHRVELARARASYLTTLGLEVR
jgi:outer membrane protein TolC